MTRWNQKDYDEYMQIYNQAIKPYHPDTMEPDEGKESILQGKITKWSKDKGYPCLSFRQSKKVKTILTPGWPDITLILPERVVFLELKDKRGRLSQDQKDIALKMLHLGAEWYEVRSYKRFLEIVNKKEGG